MRSVGRLRRRSRAGPLLVGRSDDDACRPTFEGPTYGYFVPGGPLEKDTCRDYVLPLLKAAGWGEDQVLEQFPITDGRVVPVGKKHRRAKPLRADYVLEYEPGLSLGVVEAK